MKINGENYPTLAVFENMVTVPDCFVKRQNKIGNGNGEAKLYIASKDRMREFYEFKQNKAKCFLLKTDLIAYLMAVKNEYYSPSQEYAAKDEMQHLWNERLQKVAALDDVILFSVTDQIQIRESRGYIKSEDDAYDLIREIALPLISYIYIEKVGDERNPLFYWKLFVDFDAIWEKQNGPLVFHYGKKADEAEKKEKKSSKEAKEEKKRENIIRAREGQGEYRDQLLEQCRFCPFTGISDVRLLIASHIKPWAVCNDDEKTDPYNGYILSPMYDKLFDRGFITFTPDRHIVLSEMIAPYTWKQIGLVNNSFIKQLPMDEKREKYLEFHHKSVFKGVYDLEGK